MPPREEENRTLKQMVAAPGLGTTPQEVIAKNFEAW